MWTEATMPFGQSVIVSLLGTSTVNLMIALAFSCASSFARIVRAPAAAPVVSDEADKETLAVLMATIGMDLELPADQFKIVNVKEL